MNELVKWSLLGAGGFLLYKRFIAPDSVASAGGTTGSTSAAGSFSLADLLAALKGSAPPPPATCPTGYTGTYPNCVAPAPPPPPPPPATPTVKFDSSDYGSQAWQDRVSGALNSAAGGPNTPFANTKSFDDWAWFYQNPVGGSSLSPALMGGALDAAGAVRADDGSTPSVKADQFVSYIVAAKTAGLSGIRTPLRLPVPRMARSIKALPVPPIAVIHLGQGRTAMLNMRGGN